MAKHGPKASPSLKRRPPKAGRLFEAVRTFGPAYRYPAAARIYLHIEGKPYDRGYQHGYLMAREIPEYLTRCAVDLAGKADEPTWNSYRTTSNALFLRGFDREIVEEMRGIADGADAAGAKFLGRKLDLIDIALANTTVELGELASAMQKTPTGIEGAHFSLPPYAQHDAPMDHCSAFAATGAATRDGKMIIGHVSRWSQTLAEQTNVMLDIKPETGHRMLIQSYPGGIESGTDWYQNDVGVLATKKRQYELSESHCRTRSGRRWDFSISIGETGASPLPPGPGAAQSGRTGFAPSISPPDSTPRVIAPNLLSISQ